MVNNFSKRDLFCFVETISLDIKTLSLLVFLGARILLNLADDLLVTSWYLKTETSRKAYCNKVSRDLYPVDTNRTSVNLNYIVCLFFVF